MKILSQGTWRGVQQSLRTFLIPNICFIAKELLKIWRLIMQTYYVYSLWDCLSSKLLLLKATPNTLTPVLPMTSELCTSYKPIRELCIGNLYPAILFGKAWPRFTKGQNWRMKVRKDQKHTQKHLKCERAAKTPNEVWWSGHMSLVKFMLDTWCTA